MNIMAKLQTVAKTLHNSEQNKNIVLEFIDTLLKLGELQSINFITIIKQRNIQKYNSLSFIREHKDIRAYSSNENNLIKKYTKKRLKSLGLVLELDNPVIDNIAEDLYESLNFFMINASKKSDTFQKCYSFSRQGNSYLLDIFFWYLDMKADIVREKVEKLVVFSGLVTQLHSTQPLKDEDTFFET